MKILIIYLKLMRLHKPVGIILLLWPVLWALWLANHGAPSFKLGCIFVIGTILTRSAGCIINDYCDRHIDGFVERTKMRPLATGEADSKIALGLATILLLLAFILLLQLNTLTISLSFIALGLMIIYPLSKRVSYFPQVILGIAFTYGILMAYAASLNSLPKEAFALFALSILWPIIYDTAYALADYQDDMRIGVKSIATFFHQRSPHFIALLQLIFILGWLALGLIEKLHWPFFLGLALSALLFVYQYHLLKQQKPFQVFLNNQWLGLILWLGIVGAFLI